MSDTEPLTQTGPSAPPPPAPSDDGGGGGPVAGAVAGAPGPDVSKLPGGPPSYPAPQLAHQSLMGKMFHGALSALGFGGSDQDYHRDPDTGKMVTVNTPKSPGDWARGIIAGALTGMAGAASAPKGSGPFGAVAAGFQAETKKTEEDDKGKRDAADKDYEVQKKAAYDKANMVLLNQQIAEKSWDLNAKKLDQSMKTAESENAFSQRIASDPNSRDLGVYGSFEEMVQKHPEMAPDLIKQHMAGNVIVHPSVDKDGKVNGVHMAIVSPEWKNQKIAQDSQIPVFKPPSKPGDDPTVSMQTVAAGTMTNGEYEAVNMSHWNQYLGYKTNQDKISEQRDVAAARLDAASARKEAADARSGNTRSDKSYTAAKKDIEDVGKPIGQLSDRLGRLQDSLRVGTPVADALVAPELLTVLAGGQGSGLRMTEAEISRVVGGRSNWESLKAAANKWSLDPDAANSITDSQRKQIRQLVGLVGSKLEAKKQALQQAREDLINTDDPAEHRRITVKVRQQLNDIDDGKYMILKGGGPAARPKGATMKVPNKADGKMHWSDGKNDLGVAE